MEIISYHSVNTENQERLFSRARKTAGATTNRPQNVVECLITRLQAKTELNQLPKTVSQVESTVAGAAQHAPPYRGTIEGGEGLASEVSHVIFSVLQSI